MVARKPDTNQGYLFGDGTVPPKPPKPPSKSPGLADLEPAISELAAGLPATIALGTSSWSFPGWRGLVWDRDATESTLARSGLAAYAAHPLLRTVGIDKTYYRPAPKEEFERLRQQVPPGFRFVVKSHEAITRREDPGSAGEECTLFLDASYARDQVVTPIIDGLGAAAGPIVFQFPPLGIRGEAKAESFIRELGAFIAALPVGPLYAIEVRDRLLMRPSWAAMLRDTGGLHCYNVHPSQPGPLDQAKWVDPNSQRAIVGRWMLHSGLTYSQAVDRYSPFDQIVDPDPRSRSEFSQLCLIASQAEKHVFITVNNKAEGSAPRSIRLLAESIVDLLRHPKQ